MINLNAYPKIKKAQESFSSPIISDLVAIGNCRRSGDIVSKVLSDDGDYIEIAGIHSNSFIGRTALCGRELLEITSVTHTVNTTLVYVQRAKYGTINSYKNRNLTGCSIERNFMFRTVDLFSNISLFEINGNSGNMSELFSFQVESGKIELDVDNVDDFNSNNKTSTYLFKPKSTSIHVFKGFNGERLLHYTAYFEKMYESYGRGERKITLNFFDKFGAIYDNDITDSFVFENVKVKDIITTILKTDDNMVYYSAGLSEDDFKYVKAVYSKEYTKYKDLFQAIVQHGIRLCYDELDRVKIFSDLYATKVVNDLSLPVTELNILDLKRTTDSKFIRNKFTSTFKKRQPLYNFNETLQGKHVLFRYSLPVNSFKFIVGNNDFSQLDIANDNLFSKTLINDLVLLVDNLNGNQFYGKVMDKTAPNTTNILVGQFSKDSYMIPIGKYEWLQSQHYDLPRNFTLHYSRETLPEVLNLSIKYASGTKSQALRFPLLPQIIGEEEELQGWDISFGAVADLNEGKYAGITTNVDGIYGTWDNSNLLYDRELDQFGGSKPPIYLLTNRITAPLGNSKDIIPKYNTFDNSNVRLSIQKSQVSGYDIRADFKNTISIDKSLVKNLQPLARTLNNTLKVPSLTGINVGDVLIIQPRANMSVIDDDTYTIVKNIRYVVINCFTEGGDSYITLSDNYPRAESDAFVFASKLYPATSIVFLQEMFVRGNPIIEKEFPINIVNQPSIDAYGEIPYQFDAKFYDEYAYKDLLDYFYRGFGAVGDYDRKYVYPLKIRDYWHINKGDIISFKDSMYTKVGVESKWYVLSVSHRSKSQEILLNVINLNNFDADGSWIKDFNPSLSYKPSSEVSYEYNSVDSGGSVLRETDDVFGQVVANKIPRDKFRANIVSLINGILTFDNFQGTDLDVKKPLLFSVDNSQNFIVQIDNEYLYVKANSDNSVLVIKRNMFDTESSQISTTSNVTFYSVVSIVTPDGTLISQDLYVGNSDNYIKFDSDSGEVDISTEGTINISNKSSRLFFDKDPNPLTNKSQILLGVDWKDDTTGKVKTELEDVEFQVGEESNGGYLRYSNEKGLSMNVIDLEIDGNTILNTVKDVSTFGLNSSFSGGNKAGKSFFGQDLFNDGWYITSTLSADSRPYFNVMLNLYRVAPTYNIVQFTCNESLNKIYTLCFPASARTSYRIYTSQYAQDVNATLEYSSPTYTNNISLGNINMIHVSPTSEGSNSGLFYNLVTFGLTADDVVNELHRFNGSTDVILQRTVGSNSNNTINKLLFNIGNRIYYKRQGKLYYTLNNFTTEILVSNTVYYEYYLLRGVIYAYNYNGYNYTPENTLYKLRQDGTVEESYLVPNSLVGTADIRDFSTNSKYFYIIGFDSFHITRDFKKYTQVFKGASEDYICVLNKTYILKSRVDSTKSDISMMIGYTFGTLTY